MSRSPQAIVKALSPAQAKALRGAFVAQHPDLKAALLISIDVRMDVRGRLIAMGLLGKRPGSGLTKLGRECHEVLLGQEPS